MANRAFTLIELLVVIAIVAIPAAVLFIVFAKAREKARAGEVLVSAATSLTDAMNEIGKAYTRANPGTTVRFNFGSSGALQQQIAVGAPVDVFASASPREMDSLQRANRIEPASRIDFAGNRLVLIAPARSTLKRWDDLKAASVHRVAISNPESVPSGRYARQTLTKRGIWNVVQPKAVIGENVRQTLTYVAGGNADAGVVFATDALLERQHVRVVEEAVPGRDHSPILYPAAVIIGAPNAPAARRFVAFLQSPAAQRILAQYGFASSHPAAPGKTRSSPYPIRKAAPRVKVR